MLSFEICAIHAPHTCRDYWSTTASGLSGQDQDTKPREAWPTSRYQGDNLTSIRWTRDILLSTYGTDIQWTLGVWESLSHAPDLPRIP